MSGSRDPEFAREALRHLDMLGAHVDREELEDQIIVDAVCMRLAAAIESASRMRAETLASAFGGDWPAIWGMRNRIAHGYADVNAETIQLSVERDIPAFRAALAGVADRPE